MAIVPSTKYAGQTDTSEPLWYPQGKAQNVSTAGDGTGTPLEKDWVNDLWGFVQNLLDRASITPSGSPDKVGTSDYTDALDILYKRSAPLQMEKGFENVDFKTTSPFGSFSSWPVVNYLSGVDRWYAGDNAAGTDSSVYDSGDGETWSSATTLDPGTPQSLSSFTEDASGNVYVAVENDIYKTTTGLVTNFASVTPTLVNATRIYDIHYSSTWGRFYITGGPATARLETSTFANFPVFSAISVGASSTAYFIAEDDSGNLCVSVADSSVWHSSNGTTFAENTSPSAGFSKGLGWNASLGLFWGFDGANGVHFSTGGTASWTKLFDDVYNVIDCPAGLVLFKEAAATDNAHEIVLCYGNDGGTGVRAKTVAFWRMVSDADRIEALAASGPPRFTGSGSKLVWTRTGTSKLTVVDF